MTSSAMLKSRTYHDPLHGAITLRGDDPVEALLIRVIDTPEFQRLRRIRQLDTASLTFHGAEGSRFTHSLGVMHLTRRAFAHISRKYPFLEEHRVVVLLSALLHDIGHSPFSHAGEEIFGTDHEAWTIRIIQDSGLTPILDSYKYLPNLSQILPTVYTKTYPIPLVHQLVSSQLDCDRLDYLQRDSYFTGANYGRLDLDRIIMAMAYDPVTQRLVVTQKGLVAIEHYLTVRYFMYLQVYNHPKNLAARFVLGQIFTRARQVIEEIFIDDILRAWLTIPNAQLSSNTYLAGDDTLLLYHLQRWRSCNDPTLADLCRRFLDRDIFKAQDISNLDPEQRENLLTQRQCQLATYGLQPQYYCGIRTALTKGYTVYKQGIDIQTLAGLQDISLLSPLVKTLAEPMQKAWLIYQPIERLPNYKSKP
jgi:HD superfamily phosphohydrolase